MNADIGHLLRIMYCPIKYCHSSYLVNLRGEQDLFSEVVLNHWLIKYHQLTDLPEGWIAENQVARLVIHNWYRLSTIAHYIGGYLLREWLLRNGAALATDKKLRSFIALPLMHHVVIDDLSGCCLKDSGAAFIMALTPAMPQALRQRMSLCFSCDANFPQLIVKPAPEHLNLLKMAIAYAKD
ncbi:oxidoreductase [Pantoea sp. AMG 501]|uniref:oxidoreductase n=1 Tax=Pantoea sp. AMG 501 TaxID=2008894 RepID=UPI000B5A9C90|nr:oxidoreductase [Pantoea sp. AMG 501]OWY74558.1 oxidoreductase [Pantoea sp. AMG 501]